MFGNNLKKIRTEKHLTQSELGKMVGVTGAYIQQLEKGIKRKPSIELIYNLCTELDVVPWDLLYEDRELLDLFIKQVNLIKSQTDVEDLSENIDIDVKNIEMMKSLLGYCGYNTELYQIGYTEYEIYIKSKDLNVLLTEAEYEGLFNSVKNFIDFELYKFRKNKSQK